ncbi:rhomboid family intramembrane serine protease [Corynebacterium epidermidicanis]|uniref:Putative membrane protein n=1 Tax=Corynebacterium epidermidicanis TaxID=1050174 RepID=A0A0G3GST8_9CORY|nr:rhomboid family intramembrane serine protease [Corynebacterium epidermidicanis]AKK01922.1 putative membrane protein [Corynebacterium epidermidicanis]
MTPIPVVFKRWYVQAPVTVLLCLAILLVYVVTALQSLSLADNLASSSLAQAWVLFLPDMGASWFGPLRALGTAFLHVGPTHLVLNVLLLFLFGREVEQTWGSKMMAMVFVTAAVGSSAFSVLMAPGSRSAGASGVGYALMILLVLIVARRGGDLRAPLVLIAVNVVFSLTMPNIALWGHVGGLLVGALQTAALSFRSGGARWGGIWAVLGLGIGLLMWQVVRLFPHWWEAGF